MLFIGFYSEGFISVSRTVDEVIGKHIGNLKVKESDLFLLTNGGKVKSSEKFEIPLEKYLNALETELKTGILSIVPHGAASELFDLGYSIKSVTMEYPSKVKEFIMLKEFLADPHKALYDFNNNNPLFLLDSQGTLSRINGLYEELASEMPDVIARFSVPGGYSSSSLGLKHIGVINIQQLKEGTDIEKARDDLIERLKEVEGPCLSLDAPSMFDQFSRLSHDFGILAQLYGDVIKPGWRKRFFKLDP